MTHEMGKKFADALRGAGHNAIYVESFSGVDIDGVGFRCSEFGETLSVESELNQCMSVHFHDGAVSHVDEASRFVLWASGNVKRKRQWMNDEGANVERLANSMCNDIAGVKVFVSPQADTMSISLKLHSITGPDGALRFLEALRKELVE